MTRKSVRTKFFLDPVEVRQFQTRRVRMAMRADRRINPLQLRCYGRLLEQYGLKGFPVYDAVWAIVEAMKNDERGFYREHSDNRTKALLKLAQRYLDEAVAFGVLYNFQYDPYARQRQRGMKMPDPIEYVIFNLR